MELIKKWRERQPSMPRWYWWVYWSLPSVAACAWYLGLFQKYNFLNLVYPVMLYLVLMPLWYKQSKHPYLTVGILALMAISMLLLLIFGCAATEPRRACSNWTNLTWTGGRIIGRAAYTSISSCAPGGVEGTGSSLAWSPSEFEAGLEKDSYRP